MQILSRIMARFHNGKEDGSSSEDVSTEESDKDDKMVQKDDDVFAVQEDDVAKGQGDKKADVQAWKEATPQKEQAVQGGAKAPRQ